MKELIILVLTGVLVMFSEILRSRSFTRPLVWLGLLAALGVTLYDRFLGATETIFPEFPMLTFNATTLGFIQVLLVLMLLWQWLMPRFFDRAETITDLQALVIFSLIGAVCMVSFDDLIIFFLGLEILSIPLYVLAASNKNSALSNEAGYKYFLMGAFASALTLMGIALLYGATGSFNMSQISAAIARMPAQNISFVSTAAMILMAGLSFKIAAAPFHFWAPDVYQGAPTPITAFMAVIVKTAAIAAMYHIFNNGLGGLAGDWLPIIAGISALSILFGNIGALLQDNVKRMLAYSSIAHAGYMLMAVMAGQTYSAANLSFYVAGYGLASLAAFTVLYHLSHNNAQNNEVSAFDGLGKSHPVLAAVMAIALISLAGIPPAVGFMGKYQIFAGVIQRGLIWPVIVGVIGSLISVYYYFRVIVAMYTKPQSSVQTPNMTLAEEAALLFVAGLILLAGIFPGVLS
jgi:NADH-quinone oxidoreductase subunit N